jgi:hypothetical protein
VNVPQISTTVSAPICPPPVPQFAALLKNADVYTPVVQLPEADPDAVM